MQETYKISENAIKLNYANNALMYILNDTQDVEPKELRDRIMFASKLLFDNSIKEQCDKNYLTILTVMQISKAIEDDELMIKAYEYLIKHSQSDELNTHIEEILKSRVTLVDYKEDELLEHTAQMLQSMGVKTEDAYKELDLLQVDLFNKPLHIQ